MKKISSLLVYLILSCAITVLHADFSVETARTIASTSSSDDCYESINSILSRKAIEARPTAIALSDKYPKLHSQLMDLKYPSIQFDKFYENFVSRHGRIPTLRDGLNYIFGIKRNIYSKYDVLISELEKSKDPQIVFLKRELIESKRKLQTQRFEEVDLLGLEESLKDAYGKGRFSVGSLDAPIETLPNSSLFTSEMLGFLKDNTSQIHFNAEVGELTALITSKEQALARGLRFHNPHEVQSLNEYENFISEVLVKFAARLRAMSNGELKRMIELHGDGLLREAKRSMDSGDFNRSDVYKKVISKVESKEIDLVLKTNQSRVIWAEVKAYKNTLTMEVIRGDRHPKRKSIVEQLIEHKALRDILGLEHLVSLRFISPTADIAPDAKDYIRSLGYEIID